MSMLQETAIVSKVSGQYVEIVTQNQLACSICRSSSTCGSGIVEKYLSGKVFVSRVVNTLNANVDDQVIVELPKVSVVKASLITYFLPILFMFIFVLVAETSFVRTSLSFLSRNTQPNQIITIVFALLGLIFGFMITNYYNRKIKNSEQYQVRMVRLITPLDSQI